MSMIYIGCCDDKILSRLAFALCFVNQPEIEQSPRCFAQVDIHLRGYDRVEVLLPSVNWEVMLPALQELETPGCRCTASYASPAGGRHNRNAGRSLPSLLATSPIPAMPRASRQGLRGSAAASRRLWFLNRKRRILPVNCGKKHADTMVT